MLLTFNNLRQCTQIMPATAPSGQTARSCGPAELTSLQILSPAGVSEPPAHTASYKTYKRILNFDSFIRRVPLHKCPGPSQACHHSAYQSRQRCSHEPHSALPTREAQHLPASHHGGRAQLVGSGHLDGDTGAVVSAFWHHSTNWGLATVGGATAIATAAAAATTAVSSWIFFQGRRAARFRSLVVRLLRSFLQGRKVNDNTSPICLSLKYNISNMRKHDTQWLTGTHLLGCVGGIEVHIIRGVHP